MKKIPLTQGKVALIDDCDYDIVNLFKWQAFDTNKSGIFYVTSNITLNNKQRNLYMHRLIMNTRPYEQIDHIDGNGLNNQKTNLRICTQSQNLMNGRSHKGSSSRYKGVDWHKFTKKWRARIKNVKENTHKHLGYFDSEIEAAKVYNKKVKELFGEFARINSLNIRAGKWVENLIAP